jgi:hypothetical protein
MTKFKIDDVVKRIGKFQKYVVVTVLPLVDEQRYECKLYKSHLEAKFTFKENELESA